MSVQDPRTIVTPYAFRVEPDLLGLPLAGPRRRLLGMAIDLTFIGTLALAGWTATLTFLLVVFIVQATSAGGTFGHPMVRIPTRALAVLLLIGVLIGRPFGWIRSVIEEAAAPQLASISGEDGDAGGLGIEIGDDGELVSASPAALVRLGADALRFARTDDTVEARRLAGSLAARLHEEGVSPGEIAGVLGEFGADSVQQPAKWRAVLRETDRLEGLRLERLASEDSLLAMYAAALSEDTSRARALRRDVLEALSGDSIRGLERQLSERNSELAEARQELEQEHRGFSLLRAAGNLAQDLGVGFGLSGIYFTVFTVWWRGQTPGKRIVGERVVQLNGKPIGWWDSFNRFGGYAAGLATGTLGFLELIWDANRQAAHDKMVGTVVLRTRGTGEPPVRAVGFATSSVDPRPEAPPASPET